MSERPPHLIQSLVRGLTALEMAVDGGVKVSELADELDVDRSTAHRLLHTLMAQGYLQQDPLTRQFVANPAKLFLLSNQAAESLNWSAMAANHVRRLRDLTQHTANFAVLQNQEAVIIAREFALDTPTVLQSLGSRRPTYASACGKAIIAYLPAPDLERTLQTMKLARLTANTITDAGSLRAELRKVVQQGYAVDNEEDFEGVRCLASPVVDHNRQVIGSLGISGPASRLTLEQVPFAAEAVLQTAREFSAALGYLKHGPEDEATAVEHPVFGTP